jgi:hypothetical protein
VTGSTHEILGLCSLLDILVGYKVDKHLHLRLGEETQVSKWRILDGKGESGLMSDLEQMGCSPRICRLRTTSCWALWNKHYE